MRSLRFIIIIPFYNARLYILECLESVLAQTWSNWLAVCADDHSEDGSSTFIPSDPRIIKLCNDQRTTALPNIHHAIINSGIDYQDDDIFCILDGDDKFLHRYALEVVGELYTTSPECLLTYGQYMTAHGRLGHCKPYNEWQFELLRKGNFWASHLKTFKWKLYREFLRQDPSLSSYKGMDGKFFTMTYDVALMFPLMEIAGYENIEFNKHPIYYYRIHERNDVFVDSQKQLDFDKEIRLKGKFQRFFTTGRKRSFKQQVRWFLSRIKHCVLEK